MDKKAVKSPYFTSSRGMVGQVDSESEVSCCLERWEIRLSNFFDPRQSKDR
jgi:hypothetical protein